MAKVYDLAIKTGEYTDNQGQTKGRYTKLGVVMSGSDGGQFMLLEPQIDIAGCLMLQNNMAVAKGAPARDSVMVSMFEPKQEGQAPQQMQPQMQPPQQPMQQQPQGQMMQQPQQAQPMQPQQQNTNAGFQSADIPF